MTLVNIYNLLLLLLSSRDFHGRRSKVNSLLPKVTSDIKFFIPVTPPFRIAERIRSSSCLSPSILKRYIFFYLIIFFYQSILESYLCS